MAATVVAAAGVAMVAAVSLLDMVVVAVMQAPMAVATAEATAEAVAAAAGAGGAVDVVAEPEPPSSSEASLERTVGPVHVLLLLLRPS